uniref:Ubiquitin-like domain-containing protein n=1 Tax=Rhabditophanes sp. KR3021 TaxID=114890 RepID=A0AC35UCC7_9BILA
MSEEVSQQGPTAVSVIKDTGNKVELVIKVPQLKKQTQIIKYIMSNIKKPSDPSKLCANAKFTEYHLDNTSIHFVVNVYKKKKKQKNIPRISLGTYTCDIKQFPSRIDPQSAEFEILQAASGAAYIALTLIKVDNLSINWQKYQDYNGTIDVADT